MRFLRIAANPNDHGSIFLENRILIPERTGLSSTNSTVILWIEEDDGSIPPKVGHKRIGLPILVGKREFKSLRAEFHGLSLRAYPILCRPWNLV